MFITEELRRLAMMTINDVQAQIIRSGGYPSFWARAEIRELPNILVEGEHLMHIAMGWYNGGLALLCATDRRALLVDKKMLFLTIEDIRYDMISEVMYQYRLLNASITLTGIKTLHFKSWNQGKLRQLATYVQQRTLELRQYHQLPGNDPDNMPQDTQPPQNQQSAMPNTSYSQVDTISDPFPAMAETFDRTARRSTNTRPRMDATPVKNPYQLRPYFHRPKASRFLISSST